MCTAKIESEYVNATFKIDPCAEWLACILPAVIAGLPAFHEAFMKCIGATSPGTGYTPGDRTRCD